MVWKERNSQQKTPPGWPGQKKRGKGVEPPTFPLATGPPTTEQPPTHATRKTTPHPPPLQGACNAPPPRPCPRPPRAPRDASRRPPPPRPAASSSIRSTRTDPLSGNTPRHRDKKLHPTPAPQ